MSNSTANGVTLIGFIILLHAAYSCLHFKGLLQELDMELDGGLVRLPPLDVQVECLLALTIVFVGQLLGPGKGTWQPCLTTTSSTGIKRRPLAAPAFLSRDFDIYADRSQAVANLVRKGELNK